MKLLFFSLLIAMPLVSGCVEELSAMPTAPEDPIYVNGLLLVGPKIVEFAVDGPRRYLIQQIERFIQNGRVHFFCLAFPISRGYLHPGFVFSIESEEEFILRPRMIARYFGLQRDFVPQGELVFVAGYAERGVIVITNVFFCFAEAEKWLNSVRLAF